MHNYINQISILFKRLGLVVLIYTICRILFIVFNNQLFPVHTFKDFTLILIYGLKFDLSVIFATNSLFIAASLMPSTIFYKKKYQTFLAISYIPVNIIAIITNLSDIIYVRFTLKRTTWDFINMFSEDKKMLSLIPQFLTDFWYVTIIGVFFIWLIIHLFFKFYKRHKGCLSHSYLCIIEIFIAILSIALGVLIVRGGFQLRPIGIITASKYVNSNMTPTVLNTPFTLMKSVGKQPLKTLHYFNSQEEMQKYYNPVHNPEKQQKFKHLNIVVIIMESLSKEHIGTLNTNVKNYKGFTPFLDSLISHSFVCTHAYANGKTSIKGIPSVVASFPTLMENSFVSSIYSSNKVTSLASLLDTKGYETAFFHGGHNGTMGFDQFAKIAGFNKYYGKNEYNNDADYDGKWGIFDEPFFQYFANTLNTFNQPFFAAIFSLSAHHPYTIPDKYKNKFRKGKIKIQECIMYSDYALKEFFDTAKKQNWYNNTLFVITADHCSEVAMKKYNTDSGRYAVPIIYYMPADTCLQGIYKNTTQQIDILPSILDYINFDKKYFSFGQSIFKTNAFNFSVSYLNYTHQFIFNNTVVKVNNQGTYSIKKINAEMPSINADSLKTFTQAFNQTYNNCIINNCMYIKK